MVLHLNRHEFPSPKEALCQIKLKLAQWFWRGFLNFVSAFSLFRYNLPLEKERLGSFIWTNLNHHYPRMLCTKFGWNCPCGSGEDEVWIDYRQTDWRTDWRATDKRHSEKLAWVEIHIINNRFNTVIYLINAISSNILSRNCFVFDFDV